MEQKQVYHGTHDNLIFFFTISKTKYKRCILLLDPKDEDLITLNTEPTHIFALVNRNISNLIHANQLIDNLTILSLVPQSHSHLITASMLIDLFAQKYAFYPSEEQKLLLQKSKNFSNDLISCYFNLPIAHKPKNVINSNNTVSSIYRLRYKLANCTSQGAIIKLLDILEIFFKKTGAPNIIFYYLTICYLLNPSLAQKAYDFLEEYEESSTSII